MNWIYSNTDTCPKISKERHMSLLCQIHTRIGKKKNQFPLYISLLFFRPTILPRILTILCIWVVLSASSRWWLMSTYTCNFFFPFLNLSTCLTWHSLLGHACLAWADMLVFLFIIFFSTCLTWTWANLKYWPFYVHE